MARRKPRKAQSEDAPIMLETPPKMSKKTNSSSPPALLFITLTVGACIMGWFYMQQQQHSIGQLSESFTTINKRITNFQQVMDAEDAQSDPGLLVEERIFALEESQKQAQEKAEVALATSEELRNSDLLSQLWALHAEMNTLWDEIKQAALSVTTLQGMFKNQSEGFKVTKERVMAGLSFSSALTETVAGLTSTCSRVAEQGALVEALNAQLEGQASELNDLRELLYLHNVALHTHNQEIAAIKELVKAKQAMRAQALQETLSSVRMTLDEQFFTSQTLHSRIMTQLHTFHSQLANGPSNHKSTEEGHPVEKLVSSTAQDVSELQEKMEDAQEKAEEEDVNDGTEEQAEEDIMQEEQLTEENMDRDVTETQEEDESTSEEQVEEEIIGQSEEQEDADETAEDEAAEDEAAEDETEEDETTEDEAAEDETAEDEAAEDETAEDETAEDEAAEDEAAEDEAAEDETAEDETEEDETTEDEAAEDETAEDETAEDEAAEDEAAEDEAAEDETAEDETEEDETTEDEAAEDETAEDETAENEAAEDEAAEDEAAEDETAEDETEEDETTEENTADHMLEEPLEEDASKHEEILAELNHDGIMDTRTEDE
ncbi:glutamic acid-rich protein-like [Amphiprion ocellaris]|uniref:glutamic acid-rich protein-like n=1 Tax=Amphiprion ocellaris TaxID=80972 RepID=UPI002410DBB0|nr:glutamic acid-rich protein-like [Amphiprion ocellaris]